MTRLDFIKLMNNHNKCVNAVIEKCQNLMNEFDDYPVIKGMAHMHEVLIPFYYQAKQLKTMAVAFDKSFECVKINMQKNELVNIPKE